jgi:hypothetical protein
MFKSLRRRILVAAARAECEAAVDARIKAVEKDAFAAILKVCAERDAKPGTAEMVMESFRDAGKLTEKQRIARMESMEDWDDTAHAAHIAASIVFSKALLAPYTGE